MISTENLTLSFGKQVLFENVDIKFTPGNCYGLIGANGAGKSSFLKILSGELEANSGQVHITPGHRMSVLRQDHFAFDGFEVLKAVIMGHRRLYEVMEAKDAIYAKPEFTEEDGVRAGELEAEFGDLNGWDAESDAGNLLSGLGLAEEFHHLLMADLDDNQKIRVLLAQALFGNPHILLLDEPTNHLDVDSILWLEEFLANFQNTAIVISHDRHFLDKVCTHVADIDFRKVTLYTGNYSFWYMSRDLALAQARDSNKKKEDKIKELKEFIQRFSANASKSKQATSRKKTLDKIQLDEIRPSTRRYPHIVFKPEREAGKEILLVKNLTKRADGKILFKDVGMHLGKGDRVAVVGPDSVAISSFLAVLAGEEPFDTGHMKWGQTVKMGYFPKDHGPLFDTDMNLIDWLRQYSEEKEENFIRGFLGRMLFSGEESLKKARVLSGGERVRCLLSRMMLVNPNAMIFDGPTYHLDLESIQALNDALLKFEGTLIFHSHDVAFTSSLANRILEITPDGHHFLMRSYEEYLEDVEHRARN